MVTVGHRIEANVDGDARRPILTFTEGWSGWWTLWAGNHRAPADAKDKGNLHAVTLICVHLLLAIAEATLLRGIHGKCQSRKSQISPRNTKEFSNLRRHIPVICEVVLARNPFTFVSYTNININCGSSHPRSNNKSFVLSSPTKQIDVQNG